MWLINRLTPDFRIISGFPKDNKKAINKTFREFNQYCYKLYLFSKSFISIDGGKFKAVNAKDRNFAQNKLNDRIKRSDEYIMLYMPNWKRRTKTRRIPSAKRNWSISLTTARNGSNSIKLIVNT